MKKAFASLFILCILAFVAFGQSYSVFNAPAPGIWEPIGIGVAKVAQINVSGSAVAAGTVVLSRVAADYSTTNAIVTVTCVAGKKTYNETNTVFLVSGEKILRGGTATNGTCQIILNQ